MIVLSGENGDGDGTVILTLTGSEVLGSDLSRNKTRIEPRETTVNPMIRTTVSRVKRR
jgi:hypothetical protein